jgi:homoserine O-acetyltransferase/O-succinyltransferase
MKTLTALLFVSRILLAQNGGTRAAPSAERHEFVIANFRTEGGATLPEARIVYGTYGHLNAAKDNVVLLPSHYMANFQGYQWLVGPERA